LRVTPLLGLGHLPAPGLVPEVQVVSGLKMLGRIKFRAERVKAYLVWIQAFMVLDLWLNSRQLTWLEAIVLGVPVIIVIHVLDKHRVFPGEAEVSWEDNPSFQRLMKKLDRPN
jgi:hypothetical protein